jgi:hypothetical protein
MGRYAGKRRKVRHIRIIIFKEVICHGGKLYSHGNQEVI